MMTEKRGEERGSVSAVTIPTREEARQPATQDAPRNWDVDPSPCPRKFLLGDVNYVHKCPAQALNLCLSPEEKASRRPGPRAAEPCDTTQIPVCQWVTAGLP